VKPLGCQKNLLPNIVVSTRVTLYRARKSCSVCERCLHAFVYDAAKPGKPWDNYLNRPVNVTKLVNLVLDLSSSFPFIGSVHTFESAHFARPHLCHPRRIILGHSIGTGRRELGTGCKIFHSQFQLAVSTSGVWRKQNLLKPHYRPLDISCSSRRHNPKGCLRVASDTTLDLARIFRKEGREDYELCRWKGEDEVL
jgi:hypothetical protein